MNNPAPATHTPGPSWVVFQDNVYRADHTPAPFTDNDGVHHPDYHEGLVALVYGKQNLPLIAAAPELYASLETADVVFTNFGPSPESCDEDIRDAWKQIRAAIAKVTGA